MRSHAVTIYLAIYLATMLPEAQLLFILRVIDIMVAYQVIRDWMNKLNQG
jgi:hypothetical protein